MKDIFMPMNKILWIDTETTGLNPKEHGIIQIAGIIEIDGEVKEKFELFCDPVGKLVDAAALETNKFTLEQIRQFPSCIIAYKKLIKILSKYIDKYDKYDKFVLAGQNVKFDSDFLYQFFIDMGDKYYFSYIKGGAFLDTLFIVTFLQQNRIMPMLDNRKNETIAKFFGFEFAELHNAKEDIRITRKNYYGMVKLLEEMNRCKGSCDCKS